MLNQEFGREGEDIAVQYLEAKGYKIIQRNYACYFGEIDIIAQDREEFVFIEVKARKSKQYGFPVEAVDKKKRKHMTKAIAYYVMKNRMEQKLIRIDVIEVYRKNRFDRIRHIKNVMLEMDKC